MVPQTRQWLKQALWWTRIKLVYSRITLTRFTTLYFFFALFNCIVLVILQGVSFADNSKAVRLINGLLSDSGVNVTGLLAFDDGILQICDRVPGPGAICTTVFPAVGTQESWDYFSRRNSHPEVDRPAFSKTSLRRDGDDSISGDTPRSTGSVSCAQAIRWLEDVFEDEEREDIVTLLFNIWLLSLALVTILNESLPHLGTSLAGHTLGTGWAAYRIASHEQLQRNYEKIIVQGTCQSDFLGSWWNSRRAHSVPILVFNLVALVSISFFSMKLFKVYASQSFSRVGASPQVSRIYMIVLVFSACLQLTAFFSLASTTMWIGHIYFKNVHTNTPLYLAAFIVTLLLLLPWLGLGWVSVRQEGRRQFLAFSVISILLVVVSTLLFCSDLYRFIFNTWPFFATIAVTAFVLIVATSILGVWCRLNFGKGLSHYLQVSDALEGVDFTLVYFSKDNGKNDASSHLDEKYTLDSSKGCLAPRLAPDSASSGIRGQSVYSEKDGVPVKLSSTPSILDERDRTARSTTRRNKAMTLTSSLRSSIGSSILSRLSSRPATPIVITSHRGLPSNSTLSAPNVRETHIAA